ncbi:putative mfs multidrug protein [Botrytis fragariae]|uniref:Putative mfs multidrug protein n=1 Tax=Botrytis fragariae TaxID=1964551 RepID=A0A8H6AJG2_9HELO|nr:putative mfs multidrug protein [Botrytis fragariae]KAF5868420.1 putative mfs multidrug protein [Botrytis fragariae]
MSSQALPSTTESAKAECSPGFIENTQQIVELGSGSQCFYELHGSEDPQNWSKFRKWSIIGVISAMTLVVNLATGMCTPAAPQILEEISPNASKVYINIVVSIWELGEACGPLLAAPLSEVYGRYPIYHIANVLFVVFSIAGALSTNIGMLVAFRFFNGFAVASITLNSSIVGDMFIIQERGRAMAVMGIAPLLGPVSGPLIGGYMSEAIGIGMTSGVFVCGAVLDRYVKKMKASGNMKPEHRLLVMVIGSPTLLIGLFLYGWSAQGHNHWIVPVLGTAILGFGVAVTIVPTSSYLVDAFGIHVASSLAAMVTMRCVVGALPPLAGPALYNNLGLGWGNSVLGFVALVFMPVPLILMRRGEKIRMKSNLQVTF